MEKAFTPFGMEAGEHAMCEALFATRSKPQPIKVETKAFNLVLYSCGFDKWDLINTDKSGGAIVIGVEKQLLFTTLRVYPYTPSKYRIVRFLSFQMLKLKVFFQWVK